MGVYGSLTPREVYAESARVRSRAVSQTDPEERRRMEERSQALLALLIPQSALIVRSLLVDPERSARVLSGPCTPTNRVELSPDARSVLAPLLSGRGVGMADYVERRADDPQYWEGLFLHDEELRGRRLALGANALIAQLRHSTTDSDFGCGLFIITPGEMGVVASIGFPFRARRPPAPLPRSLARIPIKPVPIWAEGPSTPNSLWPLAQGQGLNYASWLSDAFVSSYEDLTLEDHRSRGGPLDAVVADGWLGVHDAARPRVAPSPAWKVFLTLRELFKRVGGRPEGMRMALETLTKAELNGLEGIGIESAAIPERYRAITSGVRLLRAYARAGAAGPAALSVSGVSHYLALPADARSDFRDFMRSAFIWKNYPQLLHPKNQGKVRETALRVTPDPDGGYTLRVEFPPTWNPIAKNSPLELPVARLRIEE